MLFAWIGALFIGITLGLLGSGGSILTVPILNYVVGQETKVAIAGSLMIVAIISLFSLLPYAKQKLVDWRTVFMFGIPGMAGAWAGALSAQYISDVIQLLIFTVLLLLAAYLMLKPMKLSDEPHAPREAYKIVIDGLLVGGVTGMVGVGGGFLIIPALVLLGGLTMRLAVGTSLVIIMIKSFAGFVGYMPVLDKLGLAVDWNIIAIFSVIGIVGGWIGHQISSKIDQKSLKKGFAFFLILMGIYLLYKNVPLLLS